MTAIFEGLEFGMTGRGKDVATARKLIEENGGTIVPRERDGLHGMIIGSNNPSEKKIALAKVHKLPSLTVNWVEDCIRHQRLLPAHCASNWDPTVPSPITEAAAYKRHQAEKSRMIRSSTPTKQNGPRRLLLIDEDDTPDKCRKSSTPGPKSRPNWNNDTDVLASTFSATPSTSSSRIRTTSAAMSHAKLWSSTKPTAAGERNALTNRETNVPSLSSVVPPKKPAVPVQHRPTTTPTSTHTAPPTARPTPRAVPRPTTTMAPRPTMTTRPAPSHHSPTRATTSGVPADNGNAPTGRIKAVTKPPVPRLAAKNQHEDPNSPEALLARVQQHPMGKGVDAEAAKQVIQQIVDTAQSVSFKDVSGLENCKQILVESVILPAKRPELFTGLRKPCSALLLFGPPGNGKTMLAKAVACECETTFFNISASAITSKWVGDSEKLVRALFGVARALSPSTIFIDEIDSLLQARGGNNEMEGSRRLKTEFLVQMDGAGNDYTQYRVLIMGATNRPFDLDDAVLRRFPKRVLVPLPEAATRKMLVRGLLSKGIKTELSDMEWDDFAQRTQSYSASDLSKLCEEMAMAPIRELDAMQALVVDPKDLRALNFTDVIEGMKSIRPSSTPALISKLEAWNNEYGSAK